VQQGALAYVGNPYDIFGYKDKEKVISIFAKAAADIIYNRRAKHQTSDAEIDFYGGESGIVYKDTFCIYGGAGAAEVDEEYIATLNKKIRWQSGYGFTWLAGSALKFYEREFHNADLLISMDIQYRNTKLDADHIVIDGVEYNIPHPEISYTSMEYNDWHIALAGGLKIDRFSAYGGVKYSDFESCLRLMKNGVLYEKDNVEADNNIGIFAGIGIKISDALNASFEASFIDEDSVSGSLSILF
jgi:hypothetical protein